MDREKTNKTINKQIQIIYNCFTKQTLSYKEKYC